MRTTEDLNTTILDFLGIDYTHVRSATIHLEAGSVPTVTLERFLLDADGKKYLDGAATGSAAMETVRFKLLPLDDES